MALQDIKETNRHGQTERWLVGQFDNSIPTNNTVCMGVGVIKRVIFGTQKTFFRKKSRHFSPLFVDLFHFGSTSVNVKKQNSATSNYKTKDTKIALFAVQIYKKFCDITP